jgi:hypothetical protein
LPAVPPAYGPDAVRHSQEAPEGAPQWYYSVDAPPPYVVAVREAFEPGVRRCLPAGDGQVGPFRVVRADAGVAIEPVPDVELDAEVARCLREQMDAMLPAGVPSAPVTVTLRASMGSIAKARILSVVQAHLGDVRRCYEDMLHFHPQLEGRVTMSFAIGPDGQVGGRSAAADPVYHAADPHSVQQQALVLVGCCIGHVMNDWRFEGRDGDGDILVNYPFAFSASP